MKYVAIFHANLNYAWLEPHQYESVIRASYETIFDGFARFPDARYVFEASGYTIEQMAKRTPDVLGKLIAAVEKGQCEFMGAPYAHPIMANVPEEDGTWSNLFSMFAYDKYLGFRPESAWNPECSWKQYVPRTFRMAGYKYLTLDFESYMTSTDPMYSWVERNRCFDMNWGGNLPAFDLDPDCRALHHPFRDIVPGLDGFCRSDRIIGNYNNYFLGRTPLETYLQSIREYTGTDESGASIIIAEDAEYTGTTAYFFIKYYRDYTRSFEIDPKGGEKLDNLLNEVTKMAQLITFKEACQLAPVDEAFYVEDGMAWHRTYAQVWANTPEATLWDPKINLLRREYKERYQPLLEGDSDARAVYKNLIEKFWFHITNSSNSDGRWPPPPNKTCAFNREWVEKEMKATEEALADIREACRPLKARETRITEAAQEAWEYGYHYTDKPTGDLRKLNLYELSHHLYAAYRMNDHGRAEEGRRLVHAIYDEFERRGFKQVNRRRLP